MHRLLIVPLILVAVAGCVDPMYKATPDYTTDITGADFVAGIDHPFLPFVPGATWTYLVGGDSMDDLEAGRFDERIEIVVLAETRTIQGMEATIVRDTVYAPDGSRIEDTYDWFGQDVDGNVWYLGEDTCEYVDDVCVDHHGAWEWGVDGALPGIQMWADPQPGAPYYQEYLEGEAQDRAQVVERGDDVTTPLGSWTDTVTTHEWSPFEPRTVETVHYVHGIGPVIKGEQKRGAFEEPELLVAYDVPGYGSGST